MVTAEAVVARVEAVDRLADVEEAVEVLRVVVAVVLATWVRRFCRFGPFLVCEIADTSILGCSRLSRRASATGES